MCAGVLVSLICTVYIFTGISLESPIGINRYDNPFHFSVVRHILETGIASPIGAGSVMGNTHAIYPSLWHALVALNSQLFSMEMVQSAWVICILLVGCIASLGTVALTLVLFKQPNLFSLFLAAILSAASAKSIFSYILSGSLFANLTGLALVPLALAWIVYGIKSTASKGNNLKGAKGRYLSIAVACLTSVVALGLAHPSTVFMLFIFLVPFAIARISAFLGKIMVVAGSVICWLVLVNSSFFARTMNCLDCVSGDKEIGLRVASLCNLDYGGLASVGYLPFAVFLVCVVLGGVLAFVLRNRFANSWYLFGLFFVLSQILCALFPENWFSIFLTGYWYRDASRFITAFVFMSGCLIAYIPTFCQLLLQKVVALHDNVAVRRTIVAATFLICLVVLTYGNDYKKYLEEYSVEKAPTASELAFMKDVSALTGDAVVLNNAENNSVWLYPTYGVNALIKGRPANQMSSMSDDLCLLIEGIDKIGEDSDYGKRVRAAAKELSLGYVVKMSGNPGVTMRFNEFDKIDYRWYEAMALIQPKTPGLKLVYERDGMQLYKVMQEFR